MDSNTRLIVKALTWQLMGLVAMTAIGFIVTGSASAGGAIAVIGAIAGLVTYFLHEKLWARVRWGRIDTHRPKP